MFENVERLPVDPILGLSAACREDTNPDKVDLTVGVYKDDSLRTPVFAAVAEAQRRLAGEETSKAYIAQGGDPDFLLGIQSLVLGSDSPAMADGRTSAVQTPGGCGALRIAAEVIRKANPAAKVWVSKPTWPNHIPLVGSTGLALAEYRYYDRDSHDVDFMGMLEDIDQASAGDVLLLHGCCHNPCGADLNEAQWREVLSLVADKGLIPFIDLAYQGLGDGLDEDATGVRLAVEMLPEVLVAASCSKNLGLYRERTGAAVFATREPAAAVAVASHAMQAARQIYSMPPAHGAILAGKVLNDPGLRSSWEAELAEMCQRINDLRAQLDDKLSAASGRDFSFIRREKGMFSFLGLTEAQVTRLREKHSVYMIGSSRVNVAGVNAGNIDYLAAAVADVLRD